MLLRMLAHHSCLTGGVRKYAVCGGGPFMRSTLQMQKCLGMRVSLGARRMCSPAAIGARVADSPVKGIPSVALLTALGFAVGFVGVTSTSLSWCDGVVDRRASRNVRLEHLGSQCKTRCDVDKDAVECGSKNKNDKDRWWYLLRVMAQDKWFYAVAALSSFFGSLATSAQGRVVGSLFDMIGSNGFAALYTPLQSLLMLFLVQSVMSFISSFALAVATTELGRRMRLAFYEASLNKDIEWFDESRTGELSHQLTQDVGELQTAVRTAFSRGIDGMTAIVSGSLYLYYANPKLAMAMFGILPVMSGAAHFLGVLLRGLSDKIRRASNKATGIANETFGAIHTVRVFGAEDRELTRYAKELDNVSRLKRVMALTAGGFYAALGLGINLITLLICGYGGFLVSSGELTRGGIAAIVTQVQILERSMARLSIVSAQLSKAFRSSEHLFDAILSEPTVNTAKGGKGLFLSIPDVQGLVRFENVGFSYPSRPNVQVFDDFSLDILPGEVVALVGQSGSGKSTISALLSRLYDVNKGRVIVDGNDLRDLDPKSLHEVVGVVSQEPVLFGNSILENIRYGKPDATPEQVRAAAQAANADAFIQDFPNKYDTELGERGVLLSGGQRQRIAIARIILRDPALLILDEATSALDNESERYVQEALDKLMHIKKRTTIIIAHRLSTVIGADKIIVLSKGKIVEMGTHTELLKHGGMYAQLYKVQKSEV